MTTPIPEDVMKAAREAYSAALACTVDDRQFAEAFTIIARALLAVQQAERERWEPIETAPKDGTVVLLYGQWAGEIHGPSDGRTPLVDIGHWTDGTSDWPGDDWWKLDTGDAYACWMRATHWRPIPDPPRILSGDPA